MSKFIEGNIVRWESASAGISKKKVGSVIEVLPANTPLSTYYPQLAREIGKKRTHESYIVKVGPKFYWPKVANLEFVSGVPAQATQSFGQAATPAKKVAAKIIESKPSPAPSVTHQVASGTHQVSDEIVNIFGISLDKSASMRGLAPKALQDYNRQIEVIRDASTKANQKSYLTVVDSIQYGRIRVRPEVNGTDINVVRPDTDYVANGHDTPLYDSVFTLIDALEATPAAKGKNVSFLLMIITDGGENASRRSAAQLRDRINALQQTDRWTFVFRVPKGHKQVIARNLGIPEGNILEWETTERGLELAAQETYSATTSFMDARSKGATRSASFFANINVDDATLKKTLTEITNQVLVYPVQGTQEIRPFVEAKGHSYVLGNSYYELMKPETVQPQKDIIIQDKVDGRIYGGQDARNLLQLPSSGNIRLKPGSTGHYDVFIQSTSVNRKLIDGTRMILRRK